MRLDFGRVTLLAATLFVVASCTSTPKAATAGTDVAGIATAQGCASKLSPEASLIYQNAALDMRPDTDMSDLLRAKVMALVFTDKLAVSDARPAAEQAAVCLEELRLNR